MERHKATVKILNSEAIFPRRRVAVSPLRFSRLFRLILISLFLFPVWFFLAPFLAERLIVEKPLARADAILVLSGSAVYRERTRKAAELYRKGVSETILLTDDGGRGGWSPAEQRNPPFVELAKNELVKQGVPAENIKILDGKGNGTMDEARILQKAARGREWKSVLLVTSGYHSRRALRTFEKVMAESIPPIEIGIAPAPVGEQTPTPLTWWLTPFGWKMVAGEYVKSFVYWVYY